jgi:hypothetical protein
LGESTKLNSEEKYIQHYKAKGMVLLNMTHNGKDIGLGEGHLISMQEIERIRKSLGLPFTETFDFYEES